jgi:putative transposase
MEASLVLEPLNRDLVQLQVKPELQLIHTKQDRQYQAVAFRELLATNGITTSMSAKGCCWDNAVMESLFSTLKHELGLEDDVETRISPQQLQRDLAFWIDEYYNLERRHSTFNHLSPWTTRRSLSLRLKSQPRIPNGCLPNRRMSKLSWEPRWISVVAPVWNQTESLPLRKLR